MVAEKRCGSAGLVARSERAVNCAWQHESEQSFSQAVGLLAAWREAGSTHLRRHSSPMAS
jgi:hypothetical protein